MGTCRSYQQRQIAEEGVAADRGRRLRTEAIAARGASRRQGAGNHHRVENHQDQSQARGDYGGQPHGRQQQDGG